MKKILAMIMAAILLFTAVACNNNDSSDEDNVKKGVETLAGKTPIELYSSSIDYIKALENYEILIDSKYVTTYEGETTEESSSTLHKCSGDTFYYLYKADYYEEFFLHDGTTLYKKINNISEKEEISYSEFMEGWGSVTEQGMLIELGETSFDKKLFIPEGEGYYLEFLISKEEYSEITGGSVESPVTYKVYFDADGNVTGFERSMLYYYYDVVLVDDQMRVYIQNVGKVQKVEAPQDPESYSVRVKAEDIDLSSVESLDLFEISSEVTDYVLFDFKVDGSVKVSETETVDNYQGKILIRLFPNVAPLTVSNFKMLVGGAFYKGLTMHRIVPDFVIQGGDPKGDGTGGAEDEIFGEFSVNGFTNNLSHKRGVVSMARSEGYDSASSQFFICHKDATNLDDKYAAFGYVVYGLDVVDVIAGLETDSDDAPKQKVTIENVCFVKKKA
jgi:cyclophilin family peptidyl-prolyl cis-trans isomerase